MTVAPPCSNREIVRHRTSKRTVLYRAPCGRPLRSLDEVFTFLRITGCRLEIDCFCFDFWVHCFTEFEPARKFCSIKVGRAGCITYPGSRVG